MTSISNYFLINLIITINGLDDSIGACFEFFQLNGYDTAATVKKLYIKLCLRCYLDKNIYPCASRVTKIMNQEKRYIDDYFYYIYSQVIETHGFDYDIDME